MAESERTLVFIKPQNEDIAYEVFDYLDLIVGNRSNEAGRSLNIHKLPRPDINLMARHYSHLEALDSQIFQETIRVFNSGTIFITYYSGPDIVSLVRTCIGNTDPQKAEDWTVRGRFRRDSLEAALREKRYLNNVIHASANPSEAKQELSEWLPFMAGA